MSLEERSDPPDAYERTGSLTGLMTSVELLRQAQDGQDRALEQLIERYLPPFRRWARHRLPTWARGVMDTDDLVQETLLGTIKNLKNFRPRGDGALQAYLHKAMLNRIRDEMRKAKRTAWPVTLDSKEPDRRPSPLNVTIEHEAYERYLQALNELRPADRQAIIARVELGQSWEQVADALHKPSRDAARVAVTRALRRLAETMARAAKPEAVR